MKKTALLFTSLAYILTACALGTPSTSDPSYPNPSYPNSSTPQTSDPNSIPLGDGLMRSEVYLDSAELLTLESYPLQFMLVVTGNLPTPCHMLDFTINPPDSDNKLDVDVYSTSNPDEMCIQVLKPFEVNIPLGSFPAGKYTLWVNGRMVAEFQA
jgi:hypothetical protein